MMKKLAVLILAAVMTLMCAVTSFAADGQNGHTVTGKFYSGMAFEVLDKVNAEREKAGLGKLTMDKELFAAAKVRAAECAVEFSHTRPNGQPCTSVCDRAFGENIAMGQTSASEVMTSWMNSPGHKANILDADYKSIGIGCFLSTSGDYEWVQLFGYDNNGETATKPTASVSTETVFISFTSAQSDANNYFLITDKTVEDMYEESPASTIQGAAGQTVKLHVYKYSEEEYQGYTFIYAQEFNQNSFTWKSSDSIVATVDASGNVKITGGGTCNIYAYDGNIKRGHVTIKSPVVIKITTQPTDVTTTAGSKATFKVAASGSGLKYQWQWKSGSRDWANTTLSGYNTNTLSFTAQEAHNGRQYRCVVKDSSGNATATNSAKLTIKAGPTITTQPADVTTTAGSKATFKVAATGSGLKYQWQWKSGSRDWANTSLSGYNTNTLSFTTQEAHNGRQYRCVVTDSSGSSTASNGAKLTIKAGPAITTQPADVTTTAGSKATFKVTATGNGLKYQWQWKSGSRAWANTSLSGCNTNTLSFTTQEAHNGRQYRCVVTDSSGNSTESDAAKLTVKAGPVITQQPKAVTTAVGSKATFKVTATGNGLKYQWQWKSGSRAWANTSLSGYNTNTLSFITQEAHNGRQYRCVITDANGNTAESEGAKLTLNAD